MDDPELARRLNSLIAVAVTHKRANTVILSSIYLNEGEAYKRLADSYDESFIFQTCNRIEIYALDTAGGRGGSRGGFSRFMGISQPSEIAGRRPQGGIRCGEAPIPSGGRPRISGDRGGERGAGGAVGGGLPGRNSQEGIEGGAEVRSRACNRGGWEEN